MNVPDASDASDAHENEWDDDPDPDCSYCGGDGYTECDDPIQCCSRHLDNSWDQMCECKACGGSGLAKDQVIW